VRERLFQAWIWFSAVLFAAYWAMNIWYWVRPLLPD